MDNKKKPSILRLYQDHNDFDREGVSVLFEPEMLTWPFFCEGGDREIDNNLYVSIHRNALSALTTITPCEAKIALNFDLEKKRLIHAHRTWGEIYLNDQCILCFSHDTRLGNCPFRSLYEWPEIHDEEYKNYHQVVESTLSLWTIEQWSDFFWKRLLKKAKDLKTKAQAKRNDALELESRADTLLSTLTGKL